MMCVHFTWGNLLSCVFFFHFLLYISCLANLMDDNDAHGIWRRCSVVGFICYMFQINV